MALYHSQKQQHLTTLLGSFVLRLRYLKSDFFLASQKISIRYTKSIRTICVVTADDINNSIDYYIPMTQPVATATNVVPMAYIFAFASTIFFLLLFFSSVDKSR